MKDDILYLRFTETEYISIQDLYGNNPTQQDIKEFKEVLDKHRGKFKNKFEKRYRKMVMKYLTENLGLVPTNERQGILNWK
jgi:hypothetical protein